LYCGFREIRVLGLKDLGYHLYYERKRRQASPDCKFAQSSGTLQIRKKWVHVPKSE
jgi:hypothetical protein